MHNEMDESILQDENILDFHSEKTEVTQSWPDKTPASPAPAEFAEAEYETDIRPNSNRNSTVFLLVCVVALAAIYLFGLRHKPQEATAEQQTIEAEVDLALARLLSQNLSNKPEGKSLSEMDRIVQAFHMYPAQKQVMANCLQGNPFAYGGVGMESPPAPVKSSSPNRTPSLAERLAQQVNEFTLQSVLYHDPDSSCLINGEVLRQGQRFESGYVVKAIHPSQVVLTMDDLEFVLEVEK